MERKRSYQTGFLGTETPRNGFALLDAMVGALSSPLGSELPDLLSASNQPGREHFYGQIGRVTLYRMRCPATSHYT
jgi:hypothetical protein